MPRSARPLAVSTERPCVDHHQPLDPGDAVLGEVADRNPEGCRARGALLVGQDRAGGQRGEVVARRVVVAFAVPDTVIWDRDRGHASRHRRSCARSS